MAKLTTNDVSNISGNPVSAANTINANNALIEAAFENTLSRDGTSPNTMESDLDMNSNRIINLPDAVADQEPVTKKQLDDVVLSVNGGFQAHTHVIADVTGLTAALAAKADDTDLAGYSPVGHTHVAADVTDFNAAVDARVAAISSGVTSFNGRNGVVVPVANDYAVADINGLTAALAGKAATSHTHVANDISNATTAGKALLTAATAADQRTALGLGTAATQASTAFAAAAHTHDDRYYTETEVDAALALKADVGTTGGMTLIGSWTYSSSVSEVTFTGLSSTYKEIIVVLSYISSSSNTATISYLLGVGGTYRTTGYIGGGTVYDSVTATLSASSSVSHATPTGAADSFQARVVISHHGDSSIKTQVVYDYSTTDSDFGHKHFFYNTSTEAHDCLKVLMTSGNFDSGKILVYGVN